MAANTLEGAIQNVIDNIEAASAVAGLILKDKVHEDFHQAAKTSVDKYYSYKNGGYTKYGRQYRLYKTYDVRTDVYREGQNIVISTGVYMSSDPLEGLYHNRPWEEERKVQGKWTDVDADYVFNNFIQGLHPWTNGWPLSGAAELEYKTKKSSPSPESYLLRYRDRYNDVYFSKHLQNVMDNVINMYK